MMKYHIWKKSGRKNYSKCKSKATLNIYLTTVPAIIMIFSIIIVFPIWQVMLVVIGHQVSQSEAIMSTYKVDTIPRFSSSSLCQRYTVMSAAQKHKAKENIATEDLKHYN